MPDNVWHNYPTSRNYLAKWNYNGTYFNLKSYQIKRITYNIHICFSKIFQDDLNLKKFSNQKDNNILWHVEIMGI